MKRFPSPNQSEPQKSPRNRPSDEPAELKPSDNSSEKPRRYENASAVARRALHLIAEIKDTMKGRAHTDQRELLRFIMFCRLDDLDLEQPTLVFKSHYAAHSLRVLLGKTEEEMGIGRFTSGKDSGRIFLYRNPIPLLKALLKKARELPLAGDKFRLL